MICCMRHNGLFSASNLSMISHTKIWDSIVADHGSNFLVWVGSECRQSKRNQDCDGISASFRFLCCRTEVSRQGIHDSLDSLGKQQLVNSFLDTLETILAGDVPEFHSFAERSTHPVSLSVVITRPQHLSNLSPKVGQTFHALFSILNLWTHVSEQDINLLAHGLFRSEVGSHGVDNGCAILASPLC